MRLARLKLTWFRARRLAVELLTNRSGMAATEFAVIVPVMLTVFFGLVEFSSGVAVDRKVTLVVRTLSDLTSQSPGSVASSDLTNIFAASSGILTPYAVAPVRPIISEIYINASKVAKVQWSVGATVALVNGAATATLLGTPPHNPGTVVTIPTALAIPDTYLIWSEVTYQYVPAVGYVMAKAGVNLNDATFTRPRQSSCVDYPVKVSPALPCTALP
jgi:Flp pilus assembly protein TadG